MPRDYERFYSMWLFALFIAIPLIEIGLFIQVGGFIGLWPTLLIVLLTAMVGTWLVRQEGARALMDLRQSLNEFSDPTRPLAHGAMILFAGALLLTPGFFTDSVGLALLIPPVRDLVYRQLRGRIRTGQAGRPRPAREDIFDADYVDTTPRDANQSPSKWVAPDQD